MKSFLLLLFIVTSSFALQKFLMPDEAFIPSAKLNNAMQIEVEIKLADDIYLYSEKIKMQILDNDNINIAHIQSPQSINHDGELAYTTSPNFLVTLQNKNLTGMQMIKFKLSYQGCSDQGLCYEPLHKIFTLNINIGKLISSSISKDIKSPDTKTLLSTKKEEKVELSESGTIADTIKNENIGIILLTFLGFGLLLALTPCVFPMIPIISGVIISQGKDITTKKALMLSIVYVLAMAVAYTIAGVLAGLFGSNLQAALQTPWVIYSFSGVFVVLAFSMFGFYELKLPDSLVTKVSSSGNRGGYVGVAIMGFLSALIVGPCVAAPLAGALVYIGQTGDALLGGMALFSMSIGMGLPLIAVGVSAGKFMPKPGMWMIMVSAIFGVMMLGVAIWMLERIVDPYITMLLYAVLGLGFAIYLGALEKGGHIFKKSVAVIMFIYSFALLIGALAGSTSLIKPLEFLKPQISTGILNTEVAHVKFIKITSLEELDQLLAKNKGKKVMLDFSAEWCSACKELEEVTFADALVKQKMSEFVLIQADITENSKENKALSKKYNVFGPPAILFFDENSQLLHSKTLIGFIQPDVFLKHLKQL